MSLSFLELSERFGAWCWMENASFELLGGWVQSESLASAKIQFHSHSMRLGAHGRKLFELLPEIAGSNPENLVKPRIETAIEFVAEAAKLSSTAQRMGVAYALMSSRKAVAYRNYLASATPISEMPSIRAIAAVLADEEKDLGSGIAIWESIRKVGSAAAEAVEAISRFEAIIKQSDPFAF